MAYTTINKHTDYFNTKLYTGNGSAGNAQTGVGFQPDFLWIKNRTATQEHWLADAVRGTTKFLESNSSNAESSDGATGLASFDSDGFTVNGSARTNQNSASMVAWNWLANGAGSSNTDGSITSTVSANTTAGFSIISYTGTGSNATIGHGLNVKPACFIVKRRSAVEDWAVYHQSMTASYYINFNLSAGQQSNNRWNGEPDTSVIKLQNHTAVNASGSTYVCYAFAEKPGYSKFGSYTGNGSSSSPAFIYTGFKPSIVIVKNKSESDAWFIHDNKRDGFNDDNEYLFPSETNVEGTNTNRIRLFSNGFNVPTTDKSHNKSGNSYIYMAFGQSIVGSNNVPAVAR